MPNYTATAHTDGRPTDIFTVKAETPDEAIAAARKRARKLGHVYVIVGEIYNGTA